MKTIFTILAFISIATISSAQEQTEYLKAKMQLIKTTDSIRLNMPLNELNGNWVAKLNKEFYIDTFYVEQLWRIELDYNMSTQGMVASNHLAENDYDSLMNKYYQKLYNRLQGADKEKLKTSQRNWLKFRDSEKELNYTLYDQQYSGGGTIHKIFVSNKNAEITKQRVIELYQYLDRIWQPKKK